MENFASDYRTREVRKRRRNRLVVGCLVGFALITLLGLVGVTNASVDEDIQAMAIENEMMDRVDFLPWEEPPVMVCHWQPGAEVTLVMVKGEPELVTVVRK